MVVIRENIPTGEGVVLGSKVAMELPRFAKPMVPSGMRFDHAAPLKWFRGRVARLGSAKPATQVRILSEPLQFAEMAELAMHHLAKVDHAGSSPVLRSSLKI